MILNSIKFNKMLFRSTSESLLVKTIILIIIISVLYFDGVKDEGGRNKARKHI